MITAAKISHPLPFLDNVEMVIRPGQITGIVGPNGAGKTTLLKMLAGLLKPVSGNIELDKRSLFEIEHAQRALRIAYLEQHSFVHWPLSVRQLIELGRFPHRFNPKSSAEMDKRVIDKVIEQVGVSNLVDRQFNTLSGGERARVIIARAIAVQADYLLVDEPIASLDMKFQLEVMNLLAQQASTNTAVCVIVHDLNLAAAYCDCLYLLDKGKIVSHGAPETVLTNDTISLIFGIDVNVNENQGIIQINPVLPKYIKD